MFYHSYAWTWCFICIDFFAVYATLCSSNPCASDIRRWNKSPSLRGVISADVIHRSHCLPKSRGKKSFLLKKYYSFLFQSCCMWLMQYQSAITITPRNVQLSGLSFKKKNMPFSIIANALKYLTRQMSKNSKYEKEYKRSLKYHLSFYING